jgi:hypothetical protein
VKKKRKRSKFFDRRRALFLRAGRERLGLVELRVLLALDLHADTKTGETFVGLATIAQFAGCDEQPSRVCAALKSLRHAGFISTVRVGGGRKNPTIRRVLHDPPDAGKSADGAAARKGRVR